LDDGSSRPGYFLTGSAQDIRTSVNSGAVTASQAAFTVTSSAPIFSPGDVGKVIRFATSETAIITVFLTNQSVTVSVSQTVAATTFDLQGFTFGGDFGECFVGNASGVISGLESDLGNSQFLMFWYNGSEYRNLGGNSAAPAKVTSDGFVLYVVLDVTFRSRIYDPNTQTSQDQGDIGIESTPVDMNESHVVAMSCGTLHADASQWTKACRGFAGAVTVIHPAEAHKIGAPNDIQDGDSFAVKINESGHVLGYYQDPNDGYFNKPFYFNGSTITALPVVAGGASDPTGMNDSNVVVGTAWNGSQFVPFAWTPDIGIFYLPLLPGKTSGSARAVNNLNWIVGENDPGGVAFIYMAGVTTALIDIAAALDPLWTSINTARFANNSKQVVGFGVHNGIQKAYRLTFV